MKVFEYAKLHGITNTEAKAKLGLTSHLSIIPENVTVEPEQVKEEPVAEVIEPVVVVKAEPKEAKPLIPSVLPEGLTLEALKCQIRGLGSKSKYWHLRELSGIKTWS